MEKRWPYRFKTEKELIASFGEDWWNQMNWSHPDMNYLFGLPFNHVIDFEINLNERHYVGHYSFEHRSWTIETCMLTENTPIIPSYKPKVFVRN